MWFFPQNGVCVGYHAVVGLWRLFGLGWGGNANHNNWSLVYTTSSATYIFVSKSSSNDFNEVIMINHPMSLHRSSSYRYVLFHTFWG